MWVVSAYEKHGDGLVEELDLGGVDVAALRRLWQRPDDDPMFDSYPVTPDIADALATHVGRALRLDDYDYFLEYVSD